MYDQDNQALAHVVAQTKGNIALLVSLQKLSQYDADVFLAKLPVINSGSHAADTNASRQSALTRPVPPPPLPPHPRGSTPSSKFKAKALWDWNEGGKEPNDLTFTSGSIIEVIEDTNPDWWRGRFNGNEGLFPSTYVEKLSVDAPSFRYQQGPSPMHFPSGPTYPAPPPQQYPQQYGAPPQNYYGPPPPQGPPPGAYPPYSGPPPAQTQPVVANAEPPKKPGFLNGGLGNTLAHSAVGGAGFGAGSALAGGLVNSIF